MSLTVVYTVYSSLHCNTETTYSSLPSAGPAVRTSDMAIEGSPLAKCGLSRPPLTAIPNPNPGTCKMHHLFM